MPSIQAAVSAHELELFNEPDLKPFARIKQELTTLKNIVMLHNRIVIPKQLRPCVLEHLHSSHPGTQAMIARAVQTVYWPGFRNDIAKTRTNCETCSRYAPSNSPVLPISDPDIPQFPFQILCADFMKWAGRTPLFSAGW